MQRKIGSAAAKCSSRGTTCRRPGAYARGERALYESGATGGGATGLQALHRHREMVYGFDHAHFTARGKFVAVGTFGDQFVE